MKSAVILGGGPAGSQCALWLHLLGHDVLLVEQTAELGGLQATSPYPNEWMAGVLHQTGITFANAIQSHLLALNVPVKFSSTIDFVEFKQNSFNLQINNDRIETKKIVIATGVKPKAASFVESDHLFIGPGKKIFDYDFQNKRVAILGGGDNAFENYHAIRTQSQCCHIYARHVRARQSFLKSIDPLDLFTYPYDVDQQQLMIINENKTREYDVILVMYGWEANFPDAFMPYKQTLLNQNGFIATDQFCQTSMMNVYAIGEVVNKVHPCVTTAMAEGVIAAKHIQEKIEHLSA